MVSSRTNLPKELVAFPDLPFPDTLEESFIKHTDVLAYLETYAQVYDLKKHIKVCLLL
jgi:cation diffusion facilitator CzcD-associated flavoprotein CzcO